MQSAQFLDMALLRNNELIDASHGPPAVTCRESTVEATVGEVDDELAPDPNKLRGGVGNTSHLL